MVYINFDSAIRNLNHAIDFYFSKNSLYIKDDCPKKYFKQEQ